MTDPSLAPVPVPPSRMDRALGVLDWVRHPRRTRELRAETRGFRAVGVTRHYENSLAGRRHEAIEGAILWHRGYRPPTRVTHNAMWWTGGPFIAIPYNRELVPGWMSDRTREISRRLGFTRD